MSRHIHRKLGSRTVVGVRHESLVPNKCDCDLCNLTEKPWKSTAMDVHLDAC